MTTARYKPNIEIASNAEDLARRAVRLFVSVAQEALDARGVFHIALSGGQTPKRTLEVLAADDLAKSLSWRRIHVFWVDERYVPSDSPQSNYRLVSEALMTRVPIPADNIHGVPTEQEDITVAARSYETLIRRVFGLAEGQIPEFDLVILGMGTDGHTASLFPNSDALQNTESLACVVYACGDNKLDRITLTYPVLQKARSLAVLVSGCEKAQTLKAVLTGEPDEERYPIHLLWPVLEKVRWLVDRDAAEGI